MRVSAKADYGLRAVLDLALNYGCGHVHSAEMAARQGIPDAYLVQLLTSLRKGGLVRSVRGPKGGHSLARPPSEITVADVMTVLEGPIALTDDDDQRPTTGSGPDLLREVWAEAGTAVERVLSSVRFDELCRRHHLRRARVVYRI